MRRLVATIILSLIMIGVALGDNTAQQAKFIFDMDQSVQGNGFHNYRNDINTSSLQMSNLGHGTGSYSYEAQLLAKKETDYSSDVSTYRYSTGERKITFDEGVDFVFAPMRFGFGKSFHSGALSSLGKEETCIKNYGGLMSMNARFDSISTMSKNISVDMYLKNSSDDATNADLFALKFTNIGYTKLNLDAAFTGRGHIGVLGWERSGVPNAKNLQVDNLIDEDYLGTYHIVKKMSQAFNYTILQQKDDWLPCCSGGFDSMSYADLKPFVSARGIFDCTCSKVPTAAQFPRVY